VTFTGRIRLYLVAVAVLPSLLIIAVIYFYSVRQLESDDERRAFANVARFAAFDTDLRARLKSGIDELTASETFRRAVAMVASGTTGRMDLDPRPYGLDFLELIDTAGNVLATYHRPGLLSQQPGVACSRVAKDTLVHAETVEYDLDGPHASYTFVKDVGRNLCLYTGKYLNADLRQQIALLTDAEVSTLFKADTSLIYENMERRAVYRAEETFQAVLAGSDSAQFYLVAKFATGAGTPAFVNLLNVAIIVALASALIAIALGMYVTGKAKREIENIVSATSRVAAGDFSTPVMAYEEGEFSQLADSVSDMMLKLRQTQQRLAASEKIAAWQTLGRKIAHEIKNPLTPIAISAEDLRRSYAEGLPEFDKILRETTSTIKGEVDRMIELLDEFVAFARMKPPDIRKVPANTIFMDIHTLLRAETETGRLKLVSESKRDSLSLDPEAFKQVFINLIKNGLEASDDAVVTVTVRDDRNDVVALVEDTGPGFSEERLANSFEPYATTKPKGSGLGLVICLRIVHDHGGIMELYNRTEGGAGVRIRLPQE